jgi:release factor glutamine methyltransferase
MSEMTQSPATLRRETPSGAITDILQNGIRRLAGAGAHSSSPRLDAELLLGKILGLSRAGLIAHGSEPITVEHQQAYAALLDRRLQGTPVAYLTGTREFWSLALRVSPAVLVPRPETELLVELALQLIEDRDFSILDLGTGSGAIALAIASARPRARLTGVDVSPAALDIAMQNSRDLGLSQIRWRLGSWFDAVPGERFDMIVANPPYIAAADPALEQLAAEPVIALESGPMGLDALSAIAAEAASHLHAQGWILLEHGGGQASDVAGLLARNGFSDIRSHLDFSGKPRVTLGTVHSPQQVQT